MTRHTIAWLPHTHKSAEHTYIFKHQHLVLLYYHAPINPPIACTYSIHIQDPKRFPDVPGMVTIVRNLTGAVLMPNLKPTSVSSADCLVCGAGHGHDGAADDGQIDPVRPIGFFCRA